VKISTPLDFHFKSLSVHNGFENWMEIDNKLAYNNFSQDKMESCFHHVCAYTIQKKIWKIEIEC
jgi:hypothetical protein